jgi:phosphatidylinositol phospholipase C delta
VTHGHTLVEGVPFPDVCAAIGEAVVPGCWPVLVSLECHVPASGQNVVVQQMLEAWGDKLVKGPLKGVTESITPTNIKGRIILIVRNYMLLALLIS